MIRLCGPVVKNVDKLLGFFLLLLFWVFFFGFFSRLKYKQLMIMYKTNIFIIIIEYLILILLPAINFNPSMNK